MATSERGVRTFNARGHYIIGCLLALIFSRSIVWALITIAIGCILLLLFKLKYLHTILILTAGCIPAFFFDERALDAAIILLVSLLPDIDHPDATLGRYNPLARKGWVLHRGFTHSVIGIFVFPLPFFALGTYSYLLAVVGYAGHVLGDVLIGILPGKQTFRLRIW